MTRDRDPHDAAAEPSEAVPDSRHRAFNLSAWAVRHRALVIFFMVALGIAGGFSFWKLGRAEDPNFTIKVAIVTAIWPGATALEMQDQVADRIEKKLQELPYFDKVQTYTKPGFTAMQVVLRDSTPAREVPQLFYQLRKKLSDIRSDLPADLIGPNVNDEYGDVDSFSTWSPATAPTMPR